MFRCHHEASEATSLTLNAITEYEEKKRLDSLHERAVFESQVSSALGKAYSEIRKAAKNRLFMAAVNWASYEMANSVI